jgi:tetratricopeptide (TPR) repeat protein
MDGPDRPLERLRLLCDLGRFDEAASLAGQTVAAFPDNYSAWCYLAYALVNTDRTARALDAARHAVSLAPELPWAYRLTAIAYTRRHPMEAVQAAEQAVQLAPDDFRCYIVLSNARALAPRSEAAALEAARTAVRLRPDHVESHLVLGARALEGKDLEEAIRAFSHALTLDPHNAIAHNNLTVAQSRRARSSSMLAGAASGYARALRADPRHLGIRRNIDATMSVPLAQCTLLVFLAALVTWAVSLSTWRPLRLIPCVLLVLACARAARFARQLPPSVRGYLTTFARQPWVATTLVLDSLAAALIVASLAAPHGAMGLLSGAAAVVAFIASHLVGRKAVYFKRRAADQS